MRPATAPYNYHRDILNCMNNGRKDHRSCDLTLKVGDKVLSAHRSVLAAESEYFHTLFAQQVADNDSQEIDLSTVVEKAEDLEEVVNFVYVGSIQITSKNVLSLAELASFFQMKNLSKTIQQHMNETLSCDNCLKYYLLAKKRGLSHLEGVASIMLKARFHDYYLYKSETLEITPGDLTDFLKNGFLQFCSISHILEFLTQWILKNRTCNHVEVASEVITSIMETDNVRELPSIPKKEVSRLVLNLKSSLLKAGLSAETSETVEKFIEYFESALSANSGKRKSVNSEQEPVAKKRQVKKKQPGEMTEKQETEQVLFALAKGSAKTDVEEDMSSDSDESEYSDLEEPVHICVYQPSNKTWFYYKPVGKNCVYVKPHVNSGPKCIFFVVGDFVVTYDQFSSTIHYYNHKKNATKSKKFRTDFREGFGVSHFAGSFFTVENGTLYMVNRVLSDFERGRNTNSHFLQQVQFFGYRAKFINAKLVFERMFMTFPVPVTGGLEFDPHHEFDDRFSQDVQIKVCSKSNEMIIVHSTFPCLGPASSVVILASLTDGTEGCKMGKIILFTKEYEKELRESFIVEMDNKLLIVRDLCGKVKVLCDYVFSSENVDYETEYSEVEKDEVRFKMVDGFNFFPMSPDKFSANGTSRLWDVVVFQGKTTVLRSCDFAQNEIKVTDHMSPPLSNILAVHETCVPTSFLKKLSVVTEFQKI